MNDIERIEKLAAWNRAEGNVIAAQQLQALAEAMRDRPAERRAS